MHCRLLRILYTYVIQPARITCGADIDVIGEVGGIYLHGRLQRWAGRFVYFPDLMSLIYPQRPCVCVCCRNPERMGFLQQCIDCMETRAGAKHGMEFSVILFASHSPLFLQQNIISPLKISKFFRR